MRCTEEQELSEMSTTNGTNKPPVRPTDSNRSSSSSSSNEMNGEFRDIHSSKFMSWLLKYDWLYRKCISLQELKRELNMFKLKKYPAGGSRVSRSNQGLIKILYFQILIDFAWWRKNKNRN